MLTPSGNGAHRHEGTFDMRLPTFVSCFVLIAMLGLASSAAAQNISAAASSGVPDLAVRVLPKSASCAEASLCSLAIHVLNQGDAPYEGFISVFLDLHAPAVLPPPRPDGPPCAREDYGKFRCDLASTTLAPGAYAVIEPEFLFTATAYESSNACASLRWTPRTLIMRDRLLADAVAASGHRVEELARAAGLSSGEQSRSALLGAIIGSWGEGDAVAADDSACANFGIVTIGPTPACAPGEARPGTTCSSLAQWCPSNRQHLSAPDRCTCPAALPYWNDKTATCEAHAAKLACAAPDADPAQACRCPPDKPVLNASKGACVGLDNKVAQVAPPATRSVEPQIAPPPKPTVKPELKPQPAITSEAEVVETEIKPPKKSTQTASLAPESRPVVEKKRVRTKSASHETRRRCRGLQVWGPHLNRCLPWPIYLMGRLFRPG
jgi:hypothetical protein